MAEDRLITQICIVVNTQADYRELFNRLLDGTVNPMDELK